MKGEITAEVIGCVSDEMLDFLAKLYAPLVFEAMDKEEAEKQADKPQSH